MFDIVVILLAGFGAAAILGALTFVTVLIGVLVNAMITLFAGPVIDARLTPGSRA